MTAFPGLSIIIPVYNEENGLSQTVREIESILDSEAFRSYAFNVEVIFVNDGSGKATVDILKTIRHPSIAVVHHETNKGYGAALKSGIRHAAHGIVAITDADGTYPNDRIPELFQIMKERNLDMVIGSRAGNQANIPAIRRIPKWFIGKLANYVAQANIPDLNSGLRIMRREPVEKFLSLLPDGFSFTSTITLAMLVNGYSVKYVPINYHRRQGKSKIKPIQDTLNFIQLILRTAIFFDPLRVFVPLGFISWIFAIIAIILGVTVLGRIPDITVGIFAIGGVQIICLGLVADLINRKFSFRD